MGVARVEYMAIFVKMAKAAAMWPQWKDGRAFSIWYYGTYSAVFFFVGIIFLSLTLKIIASFEDMDGIATVIDFATVYASGLFRIVYIFCKGAAFQRLIDAMYDGFTYQSFNPEGPKLNMQKCQTLGKRVAFGYFFGSSGFILQMIVGPIFIWLTSPTADQVPLIFDGWHPFNVTAEPIHSLVFVVQSISWLIMGYTYLLGDSFWYMVIILTMGQLQIIAHTYRTVVPPDADDEDGMKELPPYTMEVMLKCVKQHQLVRRFIQDVENIVSPIIIVDFMHAVLSITFLLLDITIALSKSDWLKIMHLSEYLIISITHMFVYDWLGNELVLQEEKVTKAMYEIPWYRSQKAFATPLRLSIAAGRKPNRLTGGKFYNLTLEFFVMAMRSIFSYFMVLFQLRNDEAPI